MPIPPHLLGIYYPTDQSRADAKPLIISAGTQKDFVCLECKSEIFDGRDSVEAEVNALSDGTYDLVGPPKSPILNYDPSDDTIEGAVNCDWQSKGIDIVFDLQIMDGQLRCFYRSYPAKYSDGQSVPAYPEKPPHEYPVNATDYCLKGTPADSGSDCSIIMLRGYTLRLSFGMMDASDFVFSTDPRHPWIDWSPEPKHFFSTKGVQNAYCVEKDALDEGMKTYSFALRVQLPDGTFLKTDPTIVNRADPGPPTLT